MDSLENKLRQAMEMARKEPKSDTRDHILALLKSATEYTEQLRREQEGTYGQATA